MKSVKIAGVRLINYISDGINWKDHKDIILDFWIKNKCRDYGFNPRQFDQMFYVVDLPVKAKEDYEEWFNGYDFQNEEDKEWIAFIDGVLNIFYHTGNPMLMPEDKWYIILLKSEEKARLICEEQLFHGNPNLNSFWKLDTNTKAEEVGGRRNGYIFSNELELIQPKDTKDFYWAVAYQCPPDTVKLFYKDGDTTKSKCINWAADCKHATLLKITSSGRFLAEKVFVKGKAWRDDRYVPQDMIPPHPMTGSTLLKHINKNYFEMYGLWEEWDSVKKETKEAANQRKNAVNNMNDEEIKIGTLIPDVSEFIARGNVSPEKREYNKKIRQSIREKNKLREKEINKKMRELEKENRKKDRRERNKLNPFLSKEFKK